MRRLSPFVCVVLMFIAFSLVAPAQTPDTSTLRGTIVDASGAVVPGATVVLRNERTAVNRTTLSDANGRFTFAGIPASSGYSVTAQKQGFADATARGLVFMGGATATVSLAMNVSAQRTDVTVTGVVGEVRTDEPQIGTYLSAEHIQEVPLLNRRITFLPLLNAANRPALNQGDIFMNQNLFTTNGAGRRQTWFEVDGSSAVDLWGRQTIFTNLPVETLQEMQVLTNSFSAEYGGTTGGVVNVVTQQGTRDFHGSMVALFRPSALGAKLWGTQTISNGNQVTSDSLKQTALTVSGPLFAKTYGVVSGEYSWQDRVSPVTSPLAPQNYEGRYRGWLGFFKVDHQINDKNSVFLRGNADSLQDTNPSGAVGAQNLPSVGRVFKRRTYSVQLDEQMEISSKLLNDFRVHFDLGSPITQFVPITPSTQVVVPITGVGTFTSGTSQAAKLQNHQFGVTETMSAILGAHTMHFGGSALRAHNGGNSKEFGGPQYLGVLNYNNCALTAAECENAAWLGDITHVRSYTQAYGNADYTVNDTLWALFAQDDWKVMPRLTVNLGLRYEQQTFTDATKNFAPRVGFSFDPMGHGNTVLRGGYGIYYSTIPDNAAANWALTGPTGVFNYTATPGQVGFPTTVSAVPLPMASFPAGATMPIRSLYLRPGRAAYYNQFLPTDTLIGYQGKLLNPYAQQWTFGVEHSFAGHWVLGIDYVGSHTIRINRPLDVNPPTTFARTAQGQTRTAAVANCTRPYWVWWYQQNALTCGAPGVAAPPYGAPITSDVNDGYSHYHALDVNLRHRFSSKFDALVSYTWSHALSNVDPDIPGQNPNDARLIGHEEYGPSIFDQRHRFVFSGVYAAPFKFNIGGVVTLGSGLPFNYVTGSANGGNTAATDRPVVNGAVVSRNAGRGRAIYDVSPFIERAIPFGERVKLNLRFESVNVFNHANFVGYQNVYGNATAPATLGAPQVGIANQLPPRSVQISGKFTF